MQQGWITLKGTVDWQYQKVAAEFAVRKLAGVTGVKNAIQVRPKIEAKDVKHKIIAALHRNAQVEADNIQISVKGGKVTLDGKVRAICMNTASKATMAAMIAGRAVGVSLAMFSGLAIAAIGLVYLLAPKIQDLMHPFLQRL